MLFELEDKSEHSLKSRPHTLRKGRQYTRSFILFFDAAYKEVFVEKKHIETRAVYLIR